MSEPLALTLGAILLIIISGVTWYLLTQLKQLRYQLSVSENALQQALEKLEQFDDELLEIRTGNQGLSKKVKELISATANLSDKQQQLAEQDPQSRFYQKGAKLIAEGATLEQVMQECDLPRAEAELLFSLHQR